MKDSFPCPILKSEDYNFSFSGLKTAVLYKVNSLKKKMNLQNKLFQTLV